MMDGASTLSFFRGGRSRAHLPFVDASEAVLAEIHRFIAVTPAAAAISSDISTRIAVACHDPASAVAVRGLFRRALASFAPLRVDVESMTAELRGAVLAAKLAHTVVSIAALVGLQVSAAVVTSRRCGDDEDELGRAAQALARATPAGRFALDPLARELTRGSRAAREERGVE